MRALEPWVEAPLETFLTESGARLVLLMTGSGQVVAQHGFTRSLDVMGAAALGAGIIASTDEIAKLLGAGRFAALTRQTGSQGTYLAGFDTPRGRWIGLVVFDRATSPGIVQLFFQRMVRDLNAAAPAEAPATPVLAQNFERELNASLQALFGR